MLSSLQALGWEQKHIDSVPIMGPGKTDAEASNCKMRGCQMGHIPDVAGAEEATLQESSTGLGYLASPSFCMHTLP